jgi:uncharacterized sulfatase
MAAIVVFFARFQVCGAADKPNIILILADDLGYGDLGCYGQKKIRTPRLDRMAREGMRFTQAYAGSTVCAPSRCVLMTGLHTGHCQVRGNAAGKKQALRTEDVTVAEVLKQAGYATGLIGKWGLGDIGVAADGLPSRQGFDYFFGYLNQIHAHNHYPSFLWRNAARVPLRNTVPKENPVGGGISDNKAQYSGDLFAEESLNFVRQHQREPFFLFLALIVPHANSEAGNQGMEVPDLGEYANYNWPRPQQGHAAMVSRMDRQIGQLLDLLAELKLDEHTLVLFTSDNGPHAEGGYSPEMNDSNGALRGQKRDLTEGGIRIPLIARWPGQVPAGSTSDAICSFADVLPTLAAIGGARLPKYLDGISLMPTLFGKPQPELADRTLYWEFHEGGFHRAARQGNWKAIQNSLRQPIQLYDLASDPGEEKNLASNHPDIVDRFKKIFAEARTESADWPIPANR